MIKRVLAALAALLPGLAAFGLDIPLSAGGGGLAGALFTRYTLNAEGSIVVPVDVVSTQEINQVTYGAFLFADAAWAELGLDIRWGNNTWGEEYSARTKEGIVLVRQPNAGTGTEAALGISLLGKYPFRLNHGLSIFPLGGLEYRIALMEYRDPDIGPNYDRTGGVWEKDSRGGAYTLGAWNSLSIDIGAGLDLDLRSRLFLRTELLYGFRLQTSFERDALEKVKRMANAPDPVLWGLTSGPTLRLALGWRILGGGR